MDQTTFGHPGGNCFSACLASLLELSVDQVPYFMGDCSPGDPWLERALQWLAPMGYWALVVPLMGGFEPQGFCVLAGKSPRGDFDHAVVGWGLSIVHDPHPSRAGLETLTHAVLLVPIDPGRLGR